jgi:HEAT repeat protein
MFDMYESTIEILKEVLHQETDFTGFTESVTICEKIQTDMIKAGALEYAGDLLGFIRELEERIRSSMPQWADRLKEATITAGTRDRLQVLAESLNEQPEIDSKKIAGYLKNLGWESLGGVTDLLGDVENRDHREAICNYLSDEGKTKVDLISRGVFDKRWFVVRNSAAILARIGDEKALGYLLKIVNHEEKRVRLSIVENLKECTHLKALEILVKSVMDRDSEVREKSVKSIITFKGPEAFEAIEDIIQSENFLIFEDNDKKLLLEAYSILGGDKAVSFLTNLVLRVNPFRSSSREAMRKAAIEALAINKSEKAEKALLSLASSWRLNIRSLATSALHKRRAVMYGADDAANS